MCWIKDANSHSDQYPVWWITLCVRKRIPSNSNLRLCLLQKGFGAPSFYMQEIFFYLWRRSWHLFLQTDQNEWSKILGQFESSPPHVTVAMPDDKLSLQSDTVSLDFFQQFRRRTFQRKSHPIFLGGIVPIYEGDLHRNVHVGGGVTWRAFKSRWRLAILLEEHAQASKCLTWKIRMTFRHQQWTERCTHA